MVEEPRPLRAAFAAEMDQVRLQVEVMAVQVEVAVGRMVDVLTTGDRAVARQALAADDEIDAMLVSLTERCYDLICRESPVASDLRFLVSALRMLEELERIGDLALRVVKQAHEHSRLVANPEIFRTLVDMAHGALRSYSTAVRAWSAQDFDLAHELAAGSREVDGHYRELLSHIPRLSGGDAVAVAVAAVLVGRAIERIADHTVIIGERLRYLLTGDPAYLASEVR